MAKLKTKKVAGVICIIGGLFSLVLQLIMIVEDVSNVYTSHPAALGIALIVFGTILMRKS